MPGENDPNIIVGEMALVGLLLGLFGYFIIWLRRSPITPDPWDQETEKKLHEPDAVEVCHRCFTPKNPDGWFCEHCGCATGPYNNLMPFIYVFSEGEVLRNGVNDRLRNTPLVIVGYLLLSLGAYFVFAPVYWVALFRNLQRQRTEHPGSPTGQSEVTPVDSSS
jgi:hypothetical protein